MGLAYIWVWIMGSSMLFLATAINRHVPWIEYKGERRKAGSQMLLATAALCLHTAGHGKFLHCDDSLHHFALRPGNGGLKSLQTMS